MMKSTPEALVQAMRESGTPPRPDWYADLCETLAWLVAANKPFQAKAVYRIALQAQEWSSREIEELTSRFGNADRIALSRAFADEANDFYARAEEKAAASERSYDDD